MPDEGQANTTIPLVAAPAWTSRLDAHSFQAYWRLNPKLVPCLVTLPSALTAGDQQPACCSRCDLLVLVRPVNGTPAKIANLFAVVNPGGEGCHDSAAS